MAAIKKYEELKDLIRNGSKFLGISFLVPNYKFGLKIIITFFLIATVNLLIIFSFFREYPEILEMLKCISMQGLAIANTYKIFFVCKYGEYFEGIVEKVDKLYKNNAKSDRNRSQKLLDCLKMCEIIRRVLAVLYCSASLMFVFIPIYSYIFAEKKVLVLPIYIPYVDENTTNGYTILFVFHMIAVVYTLIGVTWFDISFITFAYHMVAFVDILEMDLNVLREKLLQENNSTTKENQRLIRNIFKFYVEIIE
jgi:hypothetical protein